MAGKLIIGVSEAPRVDNNDIKDNVRQRIVDQLS